MSDDRLGEVGPRIAAEKDDVAADPMESHHRLGHPGIIDVTFGVDAEAVVTKTLFGRTRFDTAEVDASAGKTVVRKRSVTPAGRSRIFSRAKWRPRAQVRRRTKAGGTWPESFAMPGA